MYDILNNHRVMVVRSVATEAAAGAAANSPASELDLHTYGLANRALLVIDVTDVGTGGVLDLIVQDSPDDITYDADFITIPQITETGLYLVVVDDPDRYLRVNHNTTTDAVTWGAYLMTFEEQRRPVAQMGSVLTGTYGTGRKPKVATS